jgi:hypothetical protein
MSLEQVGAAYRFKNLSGDYVYIGDPDDAEFHPKIKLQRWEGECCLRFVYDDSKIVEKQCVVEDGRVKWQTRDFEFHFYPVKPRKVSMKHPQTGENIEFLQNELGGLEFEVILKAKPPTNSFSFPIETKGLKFYYQPPLHPDHPTWTDTDGDGVADSFRPENVVGSYAVYHATRSNMHRSKEDAEKYKCGKAFHIYRPKAVDAEGKEVWCGLHIDEAKGVLTVTIPQEFLDSAVYPVSVDPTFGYETAGSSYAFYGFTVIGSVFTSPSDVGTATSMSWYGCADSGDFTTGMKTAIYKHSDSSLVAESSELMIGSNLQWWDFSIDTNLQSSTDYVLVVFGDSDMYGYFVYYDSGDVDQGHYHENVMYPNFPDPASFAHNDNKYSIYCTYTAGATEVTVTDSISLFDSAYRGKTLSLSDQISLQENLYRHKAIAVADSISAADQLLGHKTFPVTDQLALTDAILRDKIFCLLDEVGLSDLIYRDKQLQIADQIALADAIIRSKILTVLDQISLTETILRTKTLQVTDQISLLDAAAADKTLKVLEQIGLADALLVTKLLQVAEQIGLTDAILRDKTLSVAEQIILSDAILRDKILSVADQLNLAETTLTHKTLPITDTIGVEDLVDVIKELLKTVYDTISLAEQLKIDKQLTVADVLSLSAQVLASKVLLLADAISLAETLYRHKTLPVADAISLQDTALRDKLLTVADQVGLSDTPLAHKIMQISDTVSLTEVINVLKQLLKTVVDSISLSDVVYTDKQLTVADAIRLAEQALTDKLMTVIDKIGLGDLVKVNKVILLSDSVALAELVTVSPLIPHTTFYLPITLKVKRA